MEGWSLSSNERSRNRLLIRALWAITGDGIHRGIACRSSVQPWLSFDNPFMGRL